MMQSKQKREKYQNTSNMIDSLSYIDDIHLSGLSLCLNEGIFPLGKMYSHNSRVTSRPWTSALTPEKGQMHLLVGRTSLLSN